MDVSPWEQVGDVAPDDLLGDLFEAGPRPWTSPAQQRRTQPTYPEGGLELQRVYVTIPMSSADTQEIVMETAGSAEHAVAVYAAGPPRSVTAVGTSCVRTCHTLQLQLHCDAPSKASLLLTRSIVFRQDLGRSHVFLLT